MTTHDAPDRWSLTALLPLLWLVLTIGCSPVALTEAGKNVRTITSDPPATCEDIGTVYGRGDSEEIKNGMRNEAAEKGANYVRMETYNPMTAGGSGTAFRCPTAAANK
jgi:hypothetical protein